jgi:hypothetical protein
MSTCNLHHMGVNQNHARHAVHCTLCAIASNSPMPEGGIVNVPKRHPSAGNGLLLHR